MTSREAFEKDIVVNNRNANLRRYISNNEIDYSYDDDDINDLWHMWDRIWQAAEAQFKPVAYRQTIEVYNNETSRTEYGYSDIQIMNSDLTLYAKSEA